MTAVRYFVENEVDGKTLIALVSDLGEFQRTVPRLKDRLTIKEVLRKVCSTDYHSFL